MLIAIILFFFVIMLQYNSLMSYAVPKILQKCLCIDHSGSCKLLHIL